MTETLPHATHQGKLTISDIEIPCFVLENGTRVLSGRGVTKAIGMKGRGQGIARIVSHRAIKPFIDSKLEVAITHPLKFLGVGSRAANPTSGYEATILLKICEAVLDARDAKNLKTEQEKRYASFCDVLVRAFAHIGIIALVDEATGYQEIRDREALQALLDRYLEKELAAWAKRFPDEFYKQMFRLKGWQWKGIAINRPSVVGRYTNDIVYERLAPGILDELQKRNPTDQKGQRKHKHHQWLTEDVGHPALAQHLHAVIGLMRASATWDQFQRLLNRAFQKKGRTFELQFDDET